MKTDIHPDYVVATVKCSCGNEFQTRSTNPELHVEICSNCHPFYTGKQKLVDAGGRVERFQKRYAKQLAEVQARSAKVAAAPPAPTPAPEPTPEPTAEDASAGDASTPADA